MIGVDAVPGTVERLEHVPILVPLRIHVAQSRELEREHVLRRETVSETAYT